LPTRRVQVRTEQGRRLGEGRQRHGPRGHDARRKGSAPERGPALHGMARLPGRPGDPRDDRPAARLDQGEDEVSRRPRRQADLRDARPHADVRQGLGVLEHDARHQVTGRAGRTWRARVGIVNPSRGDVLMYEYYRAAPPGVIVVPTALHLQRLPAEELTEKFAAYFRKSGFEVVTTRCLGIERPVEMAQLPPDASADVARALRRDAPGADAIHLTCPRWPTLGTLSDLERELGVPVTS